VARTVELILQQIAERVNANDPLVHRGRYVNLTFQLGLGKEEYLVCVRDGRIHDIQPRTLATETGVFSVRSDLSHWEKFWLPVPPRDYQDLFSMLPKQFARIDGDVLPLMQNLQYFKDVLASGRETEIGATNA